MKHLPVYLSMYKSPGPGGMVSIVQIGPSVQHDVDRSRSRRVQCKWIWLHSKSEVATSERGAKSVE